MKTYYDFCLEIPDGSTSIIEKDGELIGGWVEKGVQFDSDEQAEQYASEKDYPYFEKVFFENGERWRQPFVRIDSSRL